MTGKRLLVVDDDPDIRDALCEILESEGHAPVAVANGREALEHLRSHAPPQLVLLDLMMPVLDGWGFMAEQQRDPALAALPVVVVTAAGDRRPATPGARAVLGKPVTIEQLLATIAQHAL